MSISAISPVSAVILLSGFFAELARVVRRLPGQGSLR